LQKLIYLPKISSACEQLKKEIISNGKNKDNNINTNEKIKFKERIDKFGKTF
jgi:hypothetical protein